MDDTLLNLRSQVVAKEESLSRIGIPRVNYTKQDLRTGLMGRIQRKENKRYCLDLQKQKDYYKRKRIEIDNYLSSLEPVSSEYGISSSTNIPTVSFFGDPNLKRIRKQNRKQIRRTY